MNLFSPLIAAIVTLLLALILRKHGKIQDIPNERSLHKVPVPRTGGIALMAGILAGWLFLSWAWWMVLPVLGLFVMSLLDDMRGLTPGVRLAGHFVAAGIVLFGSGISWGWMLPVLLYIVWMTNLYNFMDGSDGLAGGMALAGFGFYGIAAGTSGNEAFALLCFTIAAAASGFLYHNFHPARIFMGDAGSIPLGFMAAAFGIRGWQLDLWPFWYPLLVFSPFIVDASVTLFKRARNREKLSDAHRSHYYQRLVQMGWGHRNTALVEYALMLAVGLSALLALGLKFSGQLELLGVWLLLYAGLCMWIDKRWRQHQEKAGHHAA